MIENPFLEIQLTYSKNINDNVSQILSEEIKGISDVRIFKNVLKDEINLIQIQLRSSFDNQSWSDFKQKNIKQLRNY